MSAWVKTGDDNKKPTATVRTNGNVYTGANVRCDTPPIEGWRKVDVDLVIPPNTQQLDVAFEVPNATLAWYIDDVRAHPYEAAMSTMVYDPDLYWLRAQLDDRNFATFYDYDEEGRLVQVRQETERGVVTLRTGRSGPKQQLYQSPE